jgi:hypothetical protein
MAEFLRFGDTARLRPKKKKKLHQDFTTRGYLQLGTHIQAILRVELNQQQK